MRHRKSGRRLGRNSAHRHAMYRNLAASLLRHETVRTTLPKAKELRRVVEPLITLAKQDGPSRRRLAFDRLRDEVAVGRLFTELGPRFRERPGGYLRILKMGYRRGDAAPMALMQLVDGPVEAAPAATADEAPPKKARAVKKKAPAKKAAKADAEAAPKKAKVAKKKAKKA